MGADFIEPDLVTTKDGVLIARHPALIRALREHNLDHAPVLVQSFEAANLRGQLKSRLVVLASASGTPFAGPRPYSDYV